MGFMRKLKIIHAWLVLTVVQLATNLHLLIASPVQMTQVMFPTTKLSMLMNVAQDARMVNLFQPNLIMHASCVQNNA